MHEASGTDVVWSGVWCDPAIAREQSRRARAEVEHWPDFSVYNVFATMARKVTARQITMLHDWGAGAGQYSTVWFACGGIYYQGYDNPYAAKESGGVVTPWRRLCGVRGAVLCSASLEYDSNPMGALVSLWGEQSCGALILHRANTTAGAGFFEPEPSYCGLSIERWRWNRADVEAITGTEWEWISWDHQWTGLTFKPMKSSS